MAFQLKRKLFKPVTVQLQKNLHKIGPRDGLQNEAINIPKDVKIEFINKLSETGLKTIEVTRWEIMLLYTVELKKDNIFVPCPGAKYTRPGICGGYVSCVVGCPYDGQVHPSAVSIVAEALLSHGCYEISLGDTIGVGTRATIENMIKDLLRVTTADKLAVHFHDTYGQALVNICTALEYGIRVIDSSVSGLGGCPYAKGATGNVATEDLVYMLNGMKAETGVDLNSLIEAGRYISDFIKKPSASKVNNVLYSKYFG
ncbi:hypothetical protein NQ318_010077 [Aromia moschata]|uniref:hydroxymethylglutaryl-CoA lyase n=1 Tax=Aromia moschata TaxID=1265417 RepID=A0AAV8YE86_9CUCU|nr:hypothetical protein NQ318_010077 [Aromia moschata]